MSLSDRSKYLLTLGFRAPEFEPLDPSSENLLTKASHCFRKRILLTVFDVQVQVLMIVSVFGMNTAVFDEEAVLEESGRALSAAVLRFQGPE